MRTFALLIGVISLFLAISNARAGETQGILLRENWFNRVTGTRQPFLALFSAHSWRPKSIPILTPG
jgi:hypothetical protein